MNEKTIKKLKKIIPVSLIVLFAAFLVIPNTGLPRIEENIKIIARENRNISPFPKDSINSKNFYNNFEMWYQDRLRYRDKAIREWSKLNFNIGVVVHDKIFKGTKQNWLFDKEFIINNFTQPTEKLANIVKLQNYCYNNGMKFILFIPPSKETLYRDFFPKEILKQYNEPTYFHLQGEKLFKENDINYLTITKELKQKQLNTDIDLYIPTDSHWNCFGSSFATNLLLHAISSKCTYFNYNGLNLDNSVIDINYPTGYLTMSGF